MTLVNTATGELVEAITEADVDASIERVRRHAESIWDEWAWQVENRTWLIKGFSSWDEMRREVYGGLTNVTAPRAERPELVARFRRAGLTQKETAETLGVTTKTIKRDEHPEWKGTNVPSGDDVIEAEIVEDDEPQERPVWRVTAADWGEPETRTGATDWSRQVQDISARIPIEQLTDDELAELLGAVDYLHNYIKGERALRQEGKR